MVKAGLTDGVLGRERKVDPRDVRAEDPGAARPRARPWPPPRRRRARPSSRRPRPRRARRRPPPASCMTTIKPGTGPSPKATDKVKVHYHGTLTDGTVFDSSVQRKQPATFPLNGVIKCWTEGVQLMKVGGKSQARLPGGPRLRRPRRAAPDQAGRDAGVRGRAARDREPVGGRRVPELPEVEAARRLAARVAVGRRIVACGARPIPSCSRESAGARPPRAARPARRGGRAPRQAPLARAGSTPVAVHALRHGGRLLAPRRPA